MMCDNSIDDRRVKIIGLLKEMHDTLIGIDDTLLDIKRILLNVQLISFSESDELIRQIRDEATAKAAQSSQWH